MFMKTDEIVISIVSAFFLVYITFIAFDIFIPIAFLILLASPILIIAMVWTVIKHGIYNGPELENEQEFGYLDRPRLGKSRPENFKDEHEVSC